MLDSGQNKEIMLSMELGLKKLFTLIPTVKNS